MRSRRSRRRARLAEPRRPSSHASSKSPRATASQHVLAAADRLVGVAERSLRAPPRRSMQLVRLVEPPVGERARSPRSTTGAQPVRTFGTSTPLDLVLAARVEVTLLEQALAERGTAAFSSQSGRPASRRVLDAHGARRGAAPRARPRPRSAHVQPTSASAQRLVVADLAREPLGLALRGTSASSPGTSRVGEREHRRDVRRVAGSSSASPASPSRISSTAIGSAGAAQCPTHALVRDAGPGDEARRRRSRRAASAAASASARPAS